MEQSRERRPARTRQLQARRRLAALGAVALVAAVAGAAVGAGGGSEDRPEPEASLPPQCGGTTALLAGQRLMVRTDGTPDGALLRRAREGEIAGVIVFPDTGTSDAAVRRGIERLRDAAAAGGQPPLLVATDQEGGLVKRFPAAPPLLTPGQLAESGDASDARLEGRATGNFLRGMGINVDLAPVLDVPASVEAPIALRSFGSDAETVGELGLAFAEGLRREGILATAKHFPGLGRSALDTDLAPSEVSGSRRDLRVDLKPFEAAIGQGIPLVMVGLASYQAYGGNQPAALEPRIVQGLLRDQLGYEGVAISDDLQAGALRARYEPGEAAVAAAAAGIDVLLLAQDSSGGVIAPLARAMERGKLDLAAARASCARIVALRETLAVDGANPN